MPAPTPPRRILLIRLSAFGDVVIATGLLQGLRQAHPGAEIDWLVQPEFAPFLDTQQSIRRVIAWPRKDWAALWRAWRWLTLVRTMLAFSRSLRAQRYDWVIDAQGLLKSRALAWLAGGRHRIGYRSKEPLESLLHQVVTRFPEGSGQRAAIGAEHAPMLAALGIATPPLPRFVAPAPAPSTAAIALAPFTTRLQKHWPVAHWRALIAALLADGHALTLLGGPADAAAGAELLAGLDTTRVDNRIGRTSFVEAANLIAGSRALIGVDTGLTHLAAALGRPTVAIFGSTLPYRQTAPGAAAPLTVLWLGLACSPCARKPTCGGRWDCLAGITPDAVRAALARSLSAA